MSTAQPSDVTLEGGGVITTDLTDAQIQGYLDDATYEAGEAITGYEDWDAEDKRQLEKYLGALKVRIFADRAYTSVSRETASVSYEGMSTEELKQAVDKRDPTSSLAWQTDTDRYVSSTQES